MNRGWCRNAFAFVLLGTGAISGCSVGWKYHYRGREISMNQSNIDYHKKVSADLQEQYGMLFGNAEITVADLSGSIESITDQLPALKRQSATYRAACAFIKGAAVQAPDPGSFTSAGSLLSSDAAEICKEADRANEQVTKVTDALRAREQAAEKRQEEEKKKAAKEAADKRWQAVRGVLAECKTQMRPVACDVDGITDDERADCSKRCDLMIETSLLGLEDESVKDCGAKYFKGNRKNPPTCELKLPEGHAIAPDKLTEANARCVNMCKRRIAEVTESIEESKREIATRSSPAPSGGSVSRGGGSTSASTNVEDRVHCLERKCESCVSDRALARWGSPEACLPAFERCARSCGCTHFGGNVTSLAAACR